MGVKQLFNLTGKTALVTGASQGIGKCIALALAEHGANVIINYRSNRKLATDTQSEVEAYGVKSWLWEYDLAAETISGDFHQFLSKQNIDVDILVLNASVQIRKRWDEVTADEFSLQMNVNLRASLTLIQSCVPHMIQNKWGRIVTLGSVQQYRPSKSMIVYAASKSAQLNMVRNLATQLGSQGITINNLAPGVIATIRNEEVLANNNSRESILKNIPLGFVGEANDLAATALLLCSDAGRYITGGDYCVDGGMSLPC